MMLSARSQVATANVMNAVNAVTNTASARWWMSPLALTPRTTPIAMIVAIFSRVYQGMASPEAARRRAG